GAGAPRVGGRGGVRARRVVAAGRAAPAARRRAVREADLGDPGCAVRGGRVQGERSRAGRVEPELAGGRVVVLAGGAGDDRRRADADRRRARVHLRIRARRRGGRLVADLVRDQVAVPVAVAGEDARVGTGGQADRGPGAEAPAATRGEGGL